MKRIAILGAGVSGLSAAHALEKCRRQSSDFEYTVYEASSHLGGVVCSERVQGCLIEGGPDSFLTEKSWATALCHELGLKDQLICSNDDRRKTYIVVRSRLIEIPDGLMFMVPTRMLPILRSQLFSWRTKLRMAAEWFARTPAVNGASLAADESVASFISRHYGDEMVARLADPLLSGVYGGEAAKLSLRAVLPRFAVMEAKYGSLGRAMIASRNQSQTESEAQTAPSPPKNPGAGIFTSLKGGMQQLTDALAATLPLGSVQTGSKVASVLRKGQCWKVVLENGVQGVGKVESSANEFDAVILALPAPLAGQVLQQGAVTDDGPYSSRSVMADPTTKPIADLAAELDQIRYTSSVTVALVYDAAVRAALPAGFGFLVPRCEQRSILAATFVHNKFDYRAPLDRALIRCFVGGANADAMLGISDPHFDPDSGSATAPDSDDEIQQRVRRDLRELLHITTEPLGVRVQRWPNAMAQYEVGHLERMERIRRAVEAIPQLALAGNAYGGIGIPDCVRSGGDAAARVLAHLGLASAEVAAGCMTSRGSRQKNS